MFDKVEQPGLVLAELMPANFLDLNFGSDIVLQRFIPGKMVDRKDGILARARGGIKREGCHVIIKLFAFRNRGF